MFFTAFIEARFQMRLKTDVVFIDLSSVYVTVWKEALMLKLSISPLKVIQWINNMIINQRFKVFLNNTESKWRLTSNGLPKGSIFAYFNSYVHDILETACNIFQYTNDIV